MPNELIWFLLFILEFSLLIFLYRRLGKTGLFAWVSMMTILANIQVMKTVHLFGMTATLGNIAYASIFLATDILSENYGRREAGIAVFLGFFSMITAGVIMSIILTFKPHEADFAQESLRTLFSFMPRVTIASLIAYIISQIHDIYAYEFWKKRLPAIKHIWIRNNLSTLLSQLLDTIVFTTIAFYGVYPMKDFLSIIASTYIIKALAALLDTPFIYFASWIYRKKADKMYE